MKNSDRIGIRHDETVVISGASGRFPSSANLDEFRDNLFKGVDMVTADDTRWPVGMLEFRETFVQPMSHFYETCLSLLQNFRLIFPNFFLIQVYGTFLPRMEKCQTWIDLMRNSLGFQNHKLI